MKLNKKFHYALLFCLYLTRAGRATVIDAAINLKLSKSFLEQISRKLKKNGICTSVKGSGGGYELIDNPTLLQILQSVGLSSFLSEKDRVSYSCGEQEHRAFVDITMGMNVLFNRLLSVKIRDISVEFSKHEAIMFDSVDEARVQ